MAVTSSVLAQLIEPTIFLASRPSERAVVDLLAKARGLTHDVKDAMRAAGEQLHMPSFELGVGSAFVEMLATIKQRTWLNDAIRTLEEIPKGVEALHTAAFLERSSIQVTQGELADLIGADRGNFSRQVRRLEDGGLLRSQRTGRKVLYVLTPMGSEALNEVRPGWKAVHPQTLELLDTDVAAESAVRAMTPSLQALVAQKPGDILQAVQAITVSITGSMILGAGTDFLGIARMSRRSFKGELTVRGEKKTFVDQLIAA